MRSKDHKLSSGDYFFREAISDTTTRVEKSNNFFGGGDGGWGE